MLMNLLPLQLSSTLGRPAVVKMEIVPPVRPPVRPRELLLLWDTFSFSFFCFMALSKRVAKRADNGTCPAAANGTPGTTFPLGQKDKKKKKKKTFLLPRSKFIYCWHNLQEKGIAVLLLPGLLLWRLNASLLLNINCIKCSSTIWKIAV